MTLKILSTSNPAPTFSPEGVDGGAAAVETPTVTATPSAEVSGGGDVPNESADSNDFDFPDDPSLYLDSEDVSVPADGAAAKSTPSAQEGSATPTAKPAEPATATAVEPAKPATPIAAATLPSDPAATTPVAAPATAEGGEAKPSAKPKTMVELLDEGRAQFIESLANETFKLDQAELDAIDAGEAGKVIPKLMAKVHLQGVRAMSDVLENALPNLVRQVFEIQKAHKKADDEFFESNKDLVPHREKVLEIAKLLKGHYPNIAQKEFLAKLASGARAALAAEGIAITPAAAGPTPPPNGGNGGRVSAVPAGFAPASTSAPAVRPAVPANEFAVYDQLFDADFQD